jgi:hypothetical protein
VFGNYFDLVARGWGQRAAVLEEMHEEYGPVFCLWQPFPVPPLIVTSHDIPEADAFDSVREERSMAPDSIMSLVHSPAYLAKSQALQFLKEGESWTRFEEIVKKWVPKLPSSLLELNFQAIIGKGEEVPLEQEPLNIWTLRLVVDWLLGLELSEEECEFFTEEVDHWIEEITKRTHQARWMWYVDYARWETYRMHDRALKTVVDRWRKTSPLLQAYSAERRALFSTDEVLMALAAGYSTTAIALRSCLAAVGSANDPEVAVTEVLSKEPTVPFSSKVVEWDLSCGGHTIPKGARLMRLKTLIHPARPFGAGNRRCFGQRFALRILQSAVGEILKHCRVSSASPHLDRPRGLSRGNSAPPSALPSGPPRVLLEDAGTVPQVLQNSGTLPRMSGLFASKSMGRLSTDHGVHLMSNSTVSISPLANRKFAHPQSSGHTPTKSQSPSRSDDEL